MPNETSDINSTHLTHRRPIYRTHNTKTAMKDEYSAGLTKHWTMTSFKAIVGQRGEELYFMAHKILKCVKLNLHQKSLCHLKPKCSSLKPKEQ